MSLAEQLAALTTPKPGFQDPEQDNNDVTAAKVTEFEAETDIADTDYLSVEPDQSQLRLKNARLDGDDQRYAGKKTSRKKLAKQQGMDDEEDLEDGVDIREHAAAELGHMFDGYEEDDYDEEQGGVNSEEDEGDEGSDEEEDVDGSDEEEEVEVEEDMESGGEKVEAEGEEVEAEEEEESDEVENNEGEDVEDEGNSDEVEEEQGEGVEDASEEEESDDDGADHSQGFIFDTTDEDFSKYGEMEEEDDSEDEDNENDEEKNNDDGDASDGDNVNEQADMLSNRPKLSGEVGKGKAVTHQLKTWDKLLEARIKEQKILAQVNRLPVDIYWSKLVAVPESNLSEVMKETQTSLKALLNDLHYLETILDKGPECEPPAKKKKLADFSSLLEESHASYKTERNDIITKWNDKTKLMAGKNSFASMETSTVSQIEQIMSNPSRLIERTRVKRSNFTALGRESNLEENLVQEGDENIFDDNDFYHQLLRDLIDRKTSVSADGSQLTRQWLEVQKLRSKQKKRIVDPKASKGRKIRYDIHTRLVNFMAPVYINSDREESTNQLFASLFGKRVA